MKEVKVPGVAIAIVNSKETTYEKGFGSTSIEDAALKVTPNTLFCIGSLSKPLTGVLLMRLVEEQLIQLDTPIVEYIPWFQLNKPEQSHKVTLRMLLSHTAGLPHVFEKYGSLDPKALKQLVSHLPQHPLLFEPGKTWYYSDLGIDIAGHLAEVVTGKFFNELMTEFVFEPLDMTRSTFDPRVAMTYPLALAHEESKNGDIKVIHQFAGNAAHNPSSFAITTVRDIAIFMKMILNNGRHLGKPFLKSETLNEMLTIHGDYFTLNEGGYGLAFEIDTYKGIKRVWHDGLLQSFGSWMYIAPEQELGVILVSNNSKRFWDSAEDIINHIFTTSLNLSEKTGGDLFSGKTEELDQCQGTYIGPWNGIIRIREIDQTLVIEKSGESSTLKPFGKDRFFAEGVSIGFLKYKSKNNTFTDIMVNGIPCEKVSDDPDFFYNPKDYSPYIGSYREGNDLLRFYLEEDGLFCFDKYDNKAYPCSMVSETELGIPNCVIEFIKNEYGEFHLIRLNKGKILKRVN